MLGIKGILANPGMSLGNMELAIDYMSNSDEYEPELSDIKQLIHNKKPVHNEKKLVVKPKVTKEWLINKYSLVANKPVTTKDNILDNSVIVREDIDFDFSFEEETTISTKNTDSESLVNTDNNDQTIKINTNDSINLEIDLNDDIEDDLDIDIEDNIGIEDDLDIEDNLDIDIEDELDIDIEDDLDIEDDIEDYIESENNINNDIDNIVDIDTELDIEDDLDIDIDAELDIDDNEDLFRGDTEKLESTNSKIINTNSIDNDIGSTNCSHTKKDNNIQIIKDTTLENEKIADLERQLQEQKRQNELLKQINDLKKKNNELLVKQNEEVPNKTKDNNNSKVDNINIIIENNSVGNKYDKYTSMNIEALYENVKSFMIIKGVKHNVIDIQLLNEEFGTENIRKLVNKQYLIKTKKGVTIGR